MGSFGSKTKTTQDTNQTQSGTTMPITPDWLTDAARSYVDRIGAYGDTDPNSYIAGPAPLQQQAWANASQLGGWRPQAATAAGLALNAGLGGANTAGMYAKGPQPQVAHGPMKGDPNAGPQVVQGPAGLVSGRGYSPAPDIPGYAQPRPGQPIGASNGNPAITGASQAGAYQNPYQQQVIETTLASADHDAAVRRAQLEAAGAGSNAFGGSRWGIAEGTFDSNAARDRAGLEAGLRSQGFQLANQLGMQDAGMGNNMLQFDATQRDNALNRQLAAAGLLGQQASQYGADTRADLGTMSALGEQQRGIEQDYAGAPLTQLATMGQLSGMTPYQILTGQQINSTGTGHMTGTTSQSPSLFQNLLQLGQAAAMFV